MAAGTAKTPAKRRRHPPDILVANGVNLDLLGQREPAIYGNLTLATIERELTVVAEDLAQMAGFAGCRLRFFQTNDEAAFLNEMSSRPWDGALINPGAWTHTSLALADRLAGLNLPFVEVHLSHLAQREAYRQQSFTAPHAQGVVYGLGADSYVVGFLGLLRYLARR